MRPWATSASVAFGHAWCSLFPCTPLAVCAPLLPLCQQVPLVTNAICPCPATALPPPCSPVPACPINVDETHTHTHTHARRELHHCWALPRAALRIVQHTSINALRQHTYIHTSYIGSTLIRGYHCRNTILQAHTRHVARCHHPRTTQAPPAAACVPPTTVPLIAADTSIHPAAPVYSHVFACSRSRSQNSRTTEMHNLVKHPPPVPRRDSSLSVSHTPMLRHPKGL